MTQSTLAHIITYIRSDDWILLDMSIYINLNNNNLIIIQFEIGTTTLTVTMKASNPIKIFPMPTSESRAMNLCPRINVNLPLYRANHNLTPFTTSPVKLNTIK